MTCGADAVVLFGAGGFVGRNIVAALQNDGPTVIAVTRTGRAVPGCALTVSIDSLDDLPRLPGETVAINVASHRYVAPTFRSDQPEILSQNTLIADRFYRFCLASSISEVRLASSSAVYPQAWDVLDDERPIDLNGPVHPGEAPYAWSKRWAEILADVYHQQYGIHTITFRLTNPFGPYDTLSQDEAHVAAAFVIRALSPTPMFAVRGNLDAARDFVFTGDISEVFRASLANRGTHQAMNVARGETTTVRELAFAAMTSAGAVRPLQLESGASGVTVRRATVALLHKAFPELPPFRTLAEGLDATVAWYRDALAR